MKKCGIEIVKEVNVTPEMVKQCQEIMENSSTKKESLDDGGFDDHTKVFQYEREKTVNVELNEIGRARRNTVHNPQKTLTLKDKST